MYLLWIKINYMKNEVIIKSLEKYKLSKREVDVTLLIFNGKRNLEIANDLGIKPNTVSTIKKNIYYKIGVRTSIDFYKLVYSK